MLISYEISFVLQDRLCLTHAKLAGFASQGRQHCLSLERNCRQACEVNDYRNSLLLSDDAQTPVKVRTEEQTKGAKLE